VPEGTSRVEPISEFDRNDANACEKRCNISPRRSRMAKKTRQNFFFATRADILGILVKLEEARPVQHVLTGDYSRPEPPIYTSADAIEDLGISHDGGKFERRYLVMPCGQTVTVNHIPERRGELKYLVGPVPNPDAIVLCHSGKYRNECITNGDVSLVSDSAVAKKLYQLLLRGLRTSFTRVGKTYLVGPEALQYAREGGRLTSFVGNPPSYDLKVPT
jgi:hypothetical protein